MDNTKNWIITGLVMVVLVLVSMFVFGWGFASSPATAPVAGDSASRPAGGSASPAGAASPTAGLPSPVPGAGTATGAPPAPSPMTPSTGGASPATPASPTPSAEVDVLRTRIATLEATLRALSDPLFTKSEKDALETFLRETGEEIKKIRGEFKDGRVEKAEKALLDLRALMEAKTKAAEDSLSTLRAEINGLRAEVEALADWAVPLTTGPSKLEEAAAEALKAIRGS